MPTANEDSDSMALAGEAVEFMEACATSASNSQPARCTSKNSKHRSRVVAPRWRPSKGNTFMIHVVASLHVARPDTAPSCRVRRGSRTTTPITRSSTGTRDFIERKGVRNWTFYYSIPFRQDIAKGPYKNLFTEELKRFIAACRNRTPDRLVDPVLGSFQAVCSTFEEETDVLKRDGTDVRVEFRESPEITDEPSEINGLTSLYMLGSQAGALDDDVTKVNWPAQVPSPEPSTDPLSAISGFGRQIENQGNKISAALDAVAYKAELVEDSVARLEDPRTFQLARSSRRVQAVALRTKDAFQNPDRRILRVTQAYAKEHF